MSEFVLLDTNTVIYLSKDIEYEKRYRPYLEGKTPVISFMTVAEIYEGFFRAGETTRSAKLFFENLDQYAVVPFSNDICKVFGKIRMVRKNRPISIPDAFVAATALADKLPLVTHNLKDFEDVSPELKIVS